MSSHISLQNTILFMKDINQALCQCVLFLCRCRHRSSRLGLRTEPPQPQVRALGSTNGVMGRGYRSGEVTRSGARTSGEVTSRVGIGSGGNRPRLRMSSNEEEEKKMRYLIRFGRVQWGLENYRGYFFICLLIVTTG